ncbi:MAG: gliding motility-associated C-terminal domain-containing protein, partial [Bacteroidales bacterium]|nr:gliding motility-associated C-terminal domain-containing protein [Bacteroidales bacterium]
TSLTVDTVEFYLKDTIHLSRYKLSLDAGVGFWDGDNSGAVLSEDDIATGFTYEVDHVYTWRVRNGVCPEQTDDLLIIQHDLKKYNAFSPNNDSYNQVFVMPGLIYLNVDEGDSFKFTLYNNWGTKVRETNLKQVESDNVIIDGEYLEEYVLWDGTLRGSDELAPSGTYYYYLEYSFGTLKDTKDGYIILRR